MIRPAAWSTLKLPRRLTRTTRSNSSPVYSRIGLRTLIDGVHTRPSRCPCVAARRSSGCRHAGFDDVDDVRAGCALRRSRIRRGRAPRRLRLDVQADDTGTLRRHAQRDRFADAAAGADHRDDLSAEPKHVCLHRRTLLEPRRAFIQIVARPPHRRHEQEPPRAIASEISHRREVGQAGGLRDRLHQRLRHHVRGERADLRDVRLAGPFAGRQREHACRRRPSCATERSPAQTHRRPSAPRG